mgnify:CR=1 FL=1
MFFERKNAEKLCMFQKSCTFAPSKQKDDNRSLILGYGVMVTTTDSGPVFLGSESE